jgi:cyclase
LLKVRVIPTLLWRDFGLVKGIGFDSWRRVGPVVPALKVYHSRDVDELILVDITAANNNTPPDHESVSDFSDECAVPLTVGGGITDVDQIVHLLKAGADKVSINTAAYANPALIDAAARRFGAQCVVASVDVKRMPDGSARCFSHAGSRDTGRTPVDWVRELAGRGAGEILLTSIERDGTMTGYDIPLIAEVSAAVDIPVIASGGAGNYQHMVEAIKSGGASAVAAASIFHYTEQTPAEAKAHLHAAGIPVRQNFQAS